MLIFMIARLQAICSPASNDCPYIQKNCSDLGQTSIILSNQTFLAPCNLTVFSEVYLVSSTFREQLNINATSLNMLNLTLKNSFLNVTDLEMQDIKGNILLAYSSKSIIVKGYLTLQKGVMMSQNCQFQGSTTQLNNIICPLIQTTFNNLLIYNKIIQSGKITISEQLVRQLASSRYSLLLAANALVFNRSSLDTSSLVVVADSFNLLQSKISSSGKGCQLGIGKGISVNSSQGLLCLPTGGSGNSYGGLAYAQSSDCKGIIQGFRFILHSFPYIGRINQTYGSGGTGLQYQSGAGLLQFLILGKFQIQNSQIMSNGAGDAPGCSGGSGGVISIKCKDLIGTGQITALGGNGTNNYGGGGGGLIQLYFINSSLNQFKGQLSVRGGISKGSTIGDGQNGSIWVQNCQPGYQFDLDSLSCRACPQESYKGILERQCVPCPSFKGLVYKQGENKTGLGQCYDKEQLNYRHSPIKMFILRFRGWLVVLSILYCILLILLGYSMRRFYEMRAKPQDQEIDLDKLAANVKNETLTTELRIDPRFTLRDLLFHTNRLIFKGNNTFNDPWTLPLNLPQQLALFINPNRFKEYAERLNSAARWSKWQHLLQIILLIFYPLHWLIHIKIKKKKYLKIAGMSNSLSSLIRKPNYWIGIKLSKNADYTSLYIDFFDYTAANFKYFQIKAPLLIHLSGEGSFIRPFYLCETDPLINLLFFIVNKRPDIQTFRKEVTLLDLQKRIQNNAKLSKFLRRINRLAYSLDLASPQNTFMDYLEQFIETLQIWNKQFFERFNLQIQLVIILSSVSDNAKDFVYLIGEKQQLKEISRALLIYQRMDIKLALFIYDPQHQFPIRETYQELNSPKEQSFVMHVTLFDRIRRIACIFRFLLISHSQVLTKNLDFFFLLFLHISMLIVAWVLCISELVQFYYQIKLADILPYPFIQILTASLGFVWLFSNSYGLGKMFVLLNGLSLINSIIRFFIVIGEFQSQERVILYGLSILPWLAMVFSSRRILLRSTKLNKLNLK